MGFHMLWGLFTAILIILLQCLVFGFFIGSGKTIKQKVQEYGLGGEWIQKTKDYKNQSYPALMLAILAMVIAAVMGGGVSVGTVPLWIHHVLVWIAFFLNLRSFRISYRVITDNVNGIHVINSQIRRLKDDRPPLKAERPPEQGRTSPGKTQPHPAANLFFLAMAVWVPYLYMRWSLGSRDFPYWPFLALSVFLGLWGWLKSRKSSQA